MLEAEQTCLQATRLFALAIKACEDGNCDSAYELTMLASEAFDHARRPDAPTLYATHALYRPSRPPRLG